MISGVGPEEHLKSLGIPVISDLPGVGKNLQDHVCAPMSWKLKDGVKSLNSKFRGVGLIRSVIKYFISKNGPMTSPPAEFGCYIKSNKDLSYNEIQIFGLPVTGNPDLTNSGSKAPVPDSFDGMTLAPYQVRPFSRGHIRLKSRDINDHPALTMNYLNDERDRRALIFALRWLRDLAQQPSLKKIIEGEVRPGAGVESDDEWLSWISQSLSTGYHPVGTCRMGREDDIDAVCTSDFKVRGVQGLRVIDASVMPNIICGNTNAIAVVIGDKGADLVLGKTPLKPMAS